jgi:hypothetical protein
MKLVTSLEEAVAGITSLQDALDEQPALADRLGQAHAYYVLEKSGGKVLFGFSKYVGYANMTPSAYMRDYKALDGRNTEHALSKWFEEVRPGSVGYHKLFQKLSDWLAHYGKRPRSGKSQQVRIMTVRPEFRQRTNAKSEDRNLLNLLIAVAESLPINQRHELRAAL